MNVSVDNDILSIKILDRKYNIRCPNDQAEALQKSAYYLDSQMRKVRQSAKVMSTDRVAVVTALNISHELLNYRCHHSENETNDRIIALRKKIANALAPEEQIKVY